MKLTLLVVVIFYCFSTRSQETTRLYKNTIERISNILPPTGMCPADPDGIHKYYVAFRNVSNDDILIPRKNINDFYSLINHLPSGISAHCSLDGYWANWGHWSPCSKKCNSGIMTRIQKDCIQGGLGHPCPPPSIQTQNCNTHSCYYRTNWLGEVKQFYACSGCGGALPISSPLPFCDQVVSSSGTTSCMAGYSKIAWDCWEQPPSIQMGNCLSGTPGWGYIGCWVDCYMSP